MFWFSFQVTGNPAAWLTPIPLGPRKRGQSLSLLSLSLLSLSLLLTSREGVLTC
jgi:hypothetical protein